METKIIKGRKCRRLAHGEMTKKGDRFLNGDPIKSPNWAHHLNPVEFDDCNVFRPILSPKKAKRKAKKVEKRIGYIEPDFFNPDMCPALGHWKLNDDGVILKGYVRCEIRPLVTRKKGK